MLIITVCVITFMQNFIKIGQRVKEEEVFIKTYIHKYAMTMIVKTTERV